MNYYDANVNEEIQDFIIENNDDESIYNEDYIKQRRAEMKKLKKPVKSLSIKPLDGDDNPYLKAPHEDLPSPPFSFLSIANKGSGKTTLLGNILGFYAGMFDEIHIWSPTVKNDNKWKMLIEKYKIEPEHIHEDYEEEEVSKTVNNIKNYNTDKKSKDKINVLIIFDDIIDSLPKNQRNTIMNKLTFNHRHFMISTIIISQSFRALDSKIRSNATCYSLFRCENIVEKNKIVEELCGSIGKQKFEEMFDEATAEKYCFLYINYQKINEDGMYMKCFEKYLDYPRNQKLPIEYKKNVKKMLVENDKVINKINKEEVKEIEKEIKKVEKEIKKKKKKTKTKKQKEADKLLLDIITEDNKKKYKLKKINK